MKNVYTNQDLEAFEGWGTHNYASALGIVHPRYLLRSSQHRIMDTPNRQQGEGHRPTKKIRFIT